MTALVVQGDARRLPLPDGSVDLIVTSPPYYALRSYQDAGEHYRGQLGSEATPGEYLDALWACTREWVRVLKPEGSIFVNLGDKYSSGSGGESNLDKLGERLGTGGGHSDRKAKRRSAPIAGMRPKSLLGVPWRFAIGCIDQLGLILRAEIIWSKPNPLPESVDDRVRRSHEQFFHFTKQPRYYSAVDEIREEQLEMHRRGPDSGSKRRLNGGANQGFGLAGEFVRDYNPLGKLPGSVWSIPSEPLQVPDTVGVDHYAAFPSEWPRRLILGWSPPGICTACGQGRRPVADAERTVLRRLNGEKSKANVPGKTMAGGYRGDVSYSITGYVCACTPYTDHPGSGTNTRESVAPMPGTIARTAGDGHLAGKYERIGPWREYHFDQWTSPPTRSSLILDPFGGTGTVALVAHALGRVGISVDMSSDYTRLARWRTTDRGELAKAMRVPKPAPVPEGQMEMFA